MTDSAYLNPAASDYIGRQISQFAPGTPLEGFLLNFAVPNASLFGILTMGGELCIGIAILLGLLTRFSAAMGLLLNLTFFLSATWTIHPFYFGADLPYAFGWLTLLLAGPGPFALDPVVKTWLTPPVITYMSKGKLVTIDDTSSTLTRRSFLAAAATGLTTILIAASGFGWDFLNSGKRSTAANLPPTTISPTQTPVPAVAALATQTSLPQPATAGEQNGVPTSQPEPTALPTTPGAEPTPTTQPADPALSGLTKLAGPNDLAPNQALDFTLPTGDPAVLVHNDNGYSAYVAICTHEGCKVSYYPQYKFIGCRCHGAEFDAADAGKVLRGPARRPLSSVALQVGPDGSIYLAS